MHALCVGLRLDRSLKDHLSHDFDWRQLGGCLLRNAPKCSNRKFWKELEVIDGRSCATPEEIYQMCLCLLERAKVCCISKSHAVVFQARRPGAQDGPRIWNSQLIRSAFSLSEYSWKREADSPWCSAPSLITLDTPAVQNMRVPACLLKGCRYGASLPIEFG